MWRTIHAVAYSSPPIDAFREFLEALSKVIPCETCRRDLSVAIRTGDAESSLVPLKKLTPTDDILDWTVRLHARISPGSGGDVWTREKAAASLFASQQPTRDDDSARMIGPNALAMGLAVGIMIAAVAMGILFALAYAGLAILRQLWMALWR